MNDTTYVLGAGVNREIIDRDGFSRPLINEFFQVALEKRKFSGALHTGRLQIVYDYIYKYWRKTRSDLTRIPFDLEECFTMLELQLCEAIAKKDDEESIQLHTIQSRLKGLVAELLSEFEMQAFRSDAMVRFGRVLYEAKPTILTFNYDCILEAIIESASGLNPSSPPERLSRAPFGPTKLSDDELAYSHFNWKRPLAYGIQFDLVQLPQAGASRYAEGKEFYSHPQNQLYFSPILKLHGSLNWFRYLPIRFFPALSESLEELPRDKEHSVVFSDHAQYRWGFGQPYLGEWHYDPILITPILHKQAFLHHPVYRRVFGPVWQKAQQALCNCDRLVVIGYSFPSTDFLTKKLFLEAFSDRTIEELVVVNPDTSVIQKTKELCHFEKPVIVCKDVREFLRRVAPGTE